MKWTDTERVSRVDVRSALKQRPDAIVPHLLGGEVERGSTPDRPDVQVGVERYDGSQGAGLAMVRERVQGSVAPVV